MGNRFKRLLVKGLVISSVFGLPIAVNKAFAMNSKTALDISVTKQGSLEKIIIGLDADLGKLLEEAKSFDFKSGLEDGDISPAERVSIVNKNKGQEMKYAFRITVKYSDGSEKCLVVDLAHLLYKQHEKDQKNYIKNGVAFYNKVLTEFRRKLTNVNDIDKLKFSSQMIKGLMFKMPEVKKEEESKPSESVKEEPTKKPEVKQLNSDKSEMPLPQGSSEKIILKPESSFLDKVKELMNSGKSFEFGYGSVPGEISSDQRADILNINTGKPLQRSTFRLTVRYSDGSEKCLVVDLGYFAYKQYEYKQLDYIYNAILFYNKALDLFKTKIDDELDKEIAERLKLDVNEIKKAFKFEMPIKAEVKEEPVEKLENACKLANGTEIKFPEGITEIRDCAFDLREDLISVAIPEGVTHLGDRAFEGCVNLESVTLPSTLKSMGEMCFVGCYSLEEITIPEGVEVLPESCFEECINLKTINIPKSVKSIGNDCFRDCSSLTAVNFAEDSELFEIGEYCFCNCESLESVIIPRSVKKMGKACFYGCKSLEEVCLSRILKDIGSYRVCNDTDYSYSRFNDTYFLNYLVKSECGCFNGCNIDDMRVVVYDFNDPRSQEIEEIERKKQYMQALGGANKWVKKK